MTQSKPGKQQIVIASAEGQQAALRAILDLPLADAWVVKIEPLRSAQKRSLSSNALYWKWMSEMAVHFNKRGGAFSAEEIHDVMRFRFLGTEEPRVIGKTELPPQLVSTTSLSVEQMHEYMSKIEAFAADNRCWLTIPGAGHYTDYREASN